MRAPRPGPRPPRRRPAPLVAAAAVALALLVGVAGCTGDQETPAAKPSPSPSSSTATPEPRSAPLKVVVTRVHGRLPAKARAPLEGNVRATLSQYLDAAFLRDDYPQTRFDAAFNRFTTHMRARARRDARMLTNAGYGRTTESVRAIRRTAYLSVLAPYKVAAGVTARVDLVFRVERSGQPDETVRLHGRLLLSRNSRNDWSIFGYDLVRSDTPVRSAS
ncbi:MAG: hypothetical protein HOQ22_12055 [Nocardioidaceae bacterium]|nr:hypothetical protein [Nocardioidaceae bacterium]NUS51755.1 hypothetical protein [Nocardioidaceae bacterium]